MVFEKFETWTFEAPAAPELFSAAWTFWGQRGYGLQSTGPTSFQGRSFQSKIGVHRVADLAVFAVGTGATVQIRFRADVRADVAAGGAVVAVLLLPVAVIGAAVSWSEYENDWSRERSDFWNYLVQVVKARPAPAAPVPPPLVAPPMPSATAPPPVPSAAGGIRCPSCGAPVSGAGKFCASCGAAIPSA